jgi:predicted dehydrogenase
MKIGILGFAHGHVNMYCARWRKDPDLDIQVAAGWDHDSRRLAKAAESFGLTVCSSPAALLADRSVPAVVIASETSMHADLVVKSAAAGKAIILQKPMALTLDEADRMVAAVGKAKVPFTLAWQMRVDPENLEIRRLIEEGATGRITMIRRRHCLGVLLDKSFHTAWHLDPKHNRDIFADDAAHPIDFLYWLFGMPASVTAEIATLFDPRFASDTAVVLFRYPNGPVAEVSCSFACAAGEATTEVVGDKGVIIQNYGDAPSAARKPAGARPIKWFVQGAKDWTVSDVPGAASQGQRIGNLAGPLSEFLHGRRPPIATAQEGRDVLRLVMACYESSEKGRRITL